MAVWKNEDPYSLFSLFLVADPVFLRRGPGGNPRWDTNLQCFRSLIRQYKCILWLKIRQLSPTQLSHK